MNTYDVIVVGGGLSGGLPAAAYLQKSGLDVLVIEANSELASFCCSHETWAGTLDSPHVGVSFAGNSPVIEDLALEEYGFRFRASPVILAVTLPDGSNCLICQEPARTAENFAKHSARDGRRMLGVQERVHETMVEFNELCSFSPHPDPSKLERIFEICAYAMDFSVDEMSQMTGPELCERTFESDACRQTLMTPVAFWEHGAPFARGQGAYGVTFALYYTTGIGVGGNEIQVDALTNCLLDHGGSILTNTTVDRIVVEDGRATGVVLGERSLDPGARFDARLAVLSNAGVPETLRLVGEPALSAADERLAAKMRHWKMGLRGSHVTSWLLDRRIDWGSSAFDPLINEAILVYRAFDSWEGTKR
jgi:phytoene dehydrogenase-like protein